MGEQQLNKGNLDGELERSPSGQVLSRLLAATTGSCVGGVRKFGIAVVTGNVTRQVYKCCKIYAESAAVASRVLSNLNGIAKSFGGVSGRSACR